MSRVSICIRPIIREIFAVEIVLLPLRLDDSTNITKDGQWFLSARKNTKVIQETLWQDEGRGKKYVSSDAFGKVHAKLKI